jgi:hypothetical protein
MCMNVKDNAGMGGEVISSAREMGYKLRRGVGGGAGQPYLLRRSSQAVH